MLCPAGGANEALIGTGLVTIVPSAGLGAVMVGAGGAGFHVFVTTLEISKTPLMVEDACRESVPALEAWYVKVASPVASVDVTSCCGLAPVMFNVMPRLGRATPEASIAATCTICGCPTVPAGSVAGLRARFPVGGMPALPPVPNVKARPSPQHSQ